MEFVKWSTLLKPVTPRTMKSTCKIKSIYLKNWSKIAGKKQTWEGKKCHE